MGYPPGAQHDSRAPYNQIKDEYEHETLEVDYESAYGTYPIIIEYLKCGSVIKDIDYVFKHEEPYETKEFILEGVKELIRWNEDKPLTFE